MVMPISTQFIQGRHCIGTSTWYGMITKNMGGSLVLTAHGVCLLLLRPQVLDDLLGDGTGVAVAAEVAGETHAILERLDHRAFDPLRCGAMTNMFEHHHRA